MSRSPHNPIPADLRDRLATFGKDADHIVQTFAINLESRQPKPIVYHYTNDAGLRGILENGTLWLTDIFSLNDPSELRHGLLRAQRILNQKAATGPQESRLFARLFSSLDGGIHRSGHYFICCLSEHRDDLGQWRAYADDGQGYALGFDTSALEAPFANNHKTPTSEPGTFLLTYDDSVLDDIHRQLVDKMFDLIPLAHAKGLPADVQRAYTAQLATELASRVLHAGLFFKHEAYNNEQEYRFLEVHRADALPPHKLKSRPHSLIRYREFDWKSTARAALKEILVGPASDPRKAIRFAQDCVEEFGLGTVPIRRSEIPYRVG
jgi:hypothetical protein